MIFFFFFFLSIKVHGSNLRHLPICIIHLSYFDNNRTYKSWNSLIKPCFLHKTYLSSNLVVIEIEKVKKSSAKREREFHLL